MCTYHIPMDPFSLSLPHPDCPFFLTLTHSPLPFIILQAIIVEVCRWITVPIYLRFLACFVSFFLRRPLSCCAPFFNLIKPHSCWKCCWIAKSFWVRFFFSVRHEGFPCCFRSSHNGFLNWITFMTTLCVFPRQIGYYYHLLYSITFHRTVGAQLHWQQCSYLYARQCYILIQLSVSY